MDSLASWLVKHVIFPLIITFACSALVTLVFLPDFPIYYWAFPTEIFAALALLVLLLSFTGCYGWLRERSRRFRKCFQVYKPVRRVTPSDFGIYTYHEFYLKRESDQEAEELLEESDMAFITGMPGIGKTRGAYELARKLEGYFLLKPFCRRIDFSRVKFPVSFSTKKVLLLLDDVEKYIGKLSLDEFLYELKQNSRNLKVIATCRSGKEFARVLGHKEMAEFLAGCQRHKTEPRKLSAQEEKSLAENTGRELQESTSDGTPGSIVLGLDQMKRRYVELHNEPKTVLRVLKLLRHASIFNWTEDLVNRIAGGKIFELKSKRYQWEEWLSCLQDNGFIARANGEIVVSHDSYLGDAFMSDFMISDEMLLQLKQELPKLNDARLLRDLADTFEDREDFEEAADCYQKALAIDPDDALTRIFLATALKNLGRYSEAEKEYRRAIEVQSSYPFAHATLGNLLLHLGRHSEAQKELEEALRIDPKYAWARTLLGVLLEKTERHPEAEEEYLEAIRRNPDYGWARSCLADLLLSLERNVEAEKELREAVRRIPDYYWAHLDLGRLLTDTERYLEAEKQYREAIAIDPDQAPGHTRLADLLSLTKRYSEAEREYREAIRIEPNNFWAHSGLGDLLEVRQRYSEAEEHYREALRIEPDDVWAHIDLADLLSVMGRYSEAEAQYREAIRIDPDEWWAHVDLADLLSQLGNHLEAESQYREALRIEPDDPYTRAKLARVLLEIGRDKEAKKELLKSKALFQQQCLTDDVREVDELLKKLESQ